MGIDVVIVRQNYSRTWQGGAIDERGHKAFMCLTVEDVFSFVCAVCSRVVKFWYRYSQ